MAVLKVESKAALTVASTAALMGVPRVGQRAGSTVL